MSGQARRSMTAARSFSRRQFLQGLAGAPIVPAFLSSFHERAAAERKRVKIRDVQVMVHAGPGPHLHARQDHRRTPGAYGIAEAYGSPGVGVKEQVLSLKPWLVGKDPLEIDKLYTQMGEGHQQFERHAHRWLGAQPDARGQRHRDGPVGSGGKDSRGADVDAARRQVPRQGARLRSCRAAQHARQGVVSPTGRPRRRRIPAASRATSSDFRTAIRPPTRHATCPIAC